MYCTHLLKFENLLFLTFDVFPKGEICPHFQKLQLWVKYFWQIYLFGKIITKLYELDVDIHVSVCGVVGVDEGVMGWDGCEFCKQRNIFHIKIHVATISVLSAADSNTQLVVFC